MKESLRQLYDSPSSGVAKDHLDPRAAWGALGGSKEVRVRAKTVRRHFDGILLAIETGVNNAYQEGLNARVQFSKRLANGYHHRDRLTRIVYFRDSCRFV